MTFQFFTIAICTYNRDAVLPYSLNAALGQNFDRKKFEILVVTNNCTDKTQILVDDYMSRHSIVRCVNETRQGLSFARNKAVEQAKGDMIIYVDDDAEICPDYLSHLQKLVEEEKEIGAVGGPIEVGWFGTVPPWYEAGLDRAFNHLYHGSFRMKLKYPRVIYGTNMVFPVSLLKKIGGFRTEIGIIGEGSLTKREKGVFRKIEKKERERLDTTGYGETDIEILLEIEKKEGLPVIYDPQLKVRHLISPERLTPEYILTKALWQGRSQYRLERIYGLKGGVRHAFSCLFESRIRLLLGRSSEILSERLLQSLATGYLKEWWSSLPKRLKKSSL